MEKQDGRQFTKKGELMSNFVSNLSKDDAGAQGDKFLVLRNRTRLRIVNLLKKYGGVLCVAEIAEVLEEQSSMISNHLALLRAVGLVESEKDGTYAYYTLKQDALDWYRQYIEQLTLSATED